MGRSIKGRTIIMIKFRIVHKDTKEQLTPRELEKALGDGIEGGIVLDWCGIPLSNQKGILMLLVDDKYEIHEVEDEKC